MGVPREDLLLLTRALKRGLADVKAIRKALDRQVSKPIGLLEALHLGDADARALQGDQSLPDPVKDRGLLDALLQMLVEEEHLTAADWEKFLASLTRATRRQGFAALAVPQEFDGYSLQWELARRERGVVFRARDREGKDVAIKVFRPEVPVPGGLPQVGGLAYAVMPFVDGESLEVKQPASPKRAVQAIQGAAGLLRGRAHGALSPGRILIRKNDSVAVVGFEHAKAVGLSLRSQAYAGPGNPDVHALGAVLYELLTGAPPAGETSPAARSRDVDADLDRVVSFALRGGYAEAGELADDLQRYLGGQPVTARSAAAAAAAAGKKKSRAVWAAAAVALVAVVALVLWGRRTPPPGPRSGPPEPPAAAVPKASLPPIPPPAAPRPRTETARPAEPTKPLTAEEEQRLYDTSVQAVSAGDWTAVIAIGNQAMSRGSKKDWAPYHVATAYTERNELDKALEYVTRALQVAPDSRDSLELRAQILVLRGEVKRALSEMESFHGKKVAEYNAQLKRLGSQKADDRTLLLRGVYLCLKRHYDSAEKEFTGAIDLGLKAALVWRALARKAQEDRPGAEADAKAYLKAMPTGYAADDAHSILSEFK